MREIKFRLWNNHAEEMDYKYFWINGNKMIYDDGKSYNDQELDNDLIVMQYTGCKDYKGVEIYEGDIMDNLGTKTKVFYNSSMAQFDLEYEGGDSIPLIGEDGDLNSAEVVGNIYDNNSIWEGDE